MSRLGRHHTTPTPFAIWSRRVMLGLVVIAGLSVVATTDTAQARDAGQSIANSSRGVVPDIAAGGAHTCALLNTGDITCWGFGGNGQLGNGTTTNAQTTPTPPITLPNDTNGNPTTATAITTGNNHTCALLNTGNITCWGQGDFGQLGNGNTTDQTTPTPPITLPNDADGNPTTATAITTRDNHTCALLNTGNITCWGRGDFGQLGNGNTTDRTTPTPPITLPNDADGNPTTATAITTGNNHTCAILNTGNITCWGLGSNGQLGNGTTTNAQTTPTPPITLPNDTNGNPTTATAITTGSFHTCAILNTGNVTCWGAGGNGRLGNGTSTIAQTTPTPPITLPNDTDGNPTTATAITTGDSHSCALLNTGDVTCWGRQNEGQLGNGSSAFASISQPTPPITLPTTTTATAITAGADHTCALLNTGQATCWGFGANGRLGNGTTDEQPTPTLTSPLPAVDPARQTTAIEAGFFHTCALLNTGNVTCWGHGALGRLGNGTTTDQTTPTDPITLPNDTDGNPTTATAITAGNYHTCALLNTGNITCWGQGSNGQLGNDSNGDTRPSDPVTLPTDANGNPTTATAITAGDLHTCALLNTGQVTCWGFGRSGQLGNGTIPTVQDTPTDPIDLPNDANGNPTTATAITAGSNHTCALLNTGNITCWGLGSNGQLGDGNTNTRQTTPTPPITLPDDADGNPTTATAITAGTAHTCALLNTGNITCWGLGGGGRLGNGTNDDQTIPTDPISLPDDANGDPTTATAITAGSGHTCALLNTGNITCWGAGGGGRLGNGTNDDQTIPTDPISLPDDAAGNPTTATAITAGTGHTCALLNTADITCWGNGNNGQLGNGTTTQQNTPVLVTFPTATPTLALATGQTSPTNSTTVNVTATFDQPVTLTAGDITLAGTAGATTATPVNTHAGATAGTTWNITINGITNDGTIDVTIPAGTLSTYGNTTSNTLTIHHDTTGPIADIERPPTQAGTVTATPLTFTVTFDEPVTGFTLDDITITGTTGATTTNATLTGTGTTYTITITTVPEPGTIDIQITDGAVTDALGNPSTSANHDATITINDETPPVLSLPDDITAATEPGATTATVTYQATATDPDSTGNTTRRSATLGIDAFATTNIPVTCNPPSGTAFPVGSTTVTCTATDPTGNTATGTFTITVNAITAPTTTTPPTTTTTPASPTTTTPPSPPTTAMPMPDPGIVLPATGNDTNSLQLTLMLALIATVFGATTVIVTRRR